MHGFTNILTVHGNCIGGDDALAHAVAIAAGSKARLTIAVPVDPSLPRTPGAIREVRMRVERLKPWIVEQGVSDIRIATLQGTPYVDVVRRVLDEDHDLVVACDAGGASVWDRLWPSTTAQLLRHCPCPVLQVKPGRPVCGRGVLAAIDFDEGVVDPLARRIVMTAAACARALSTPLHVVHCWKPARCEQEMLLSEISDETRRNLVQRNAGRCRGVIQALLDELSVDGEPRIHLPQGAFPEGVIELAEREEMDVVVVGCRRRQLGASSTVAAFPDGIRQSFPRSMLAVKPGQFQTSVVQAAMEAVGARAGRH